MPSEPFKGLKVPSSNALSTSASSNDSAGTTTDSSKPLSKPEDMSSPHELTAFVETLLNQLDTKFNDMSSQLLERMSQMSTRVDSLETSIHDLINGDVSAPQSPEVGTPGMLRKGSSG